MKALGLFIDKAAQINMTIMLSGNSTLRGRRSDKIRTC